MGVDMPPLPDSNGAAIFFAVAALLATFVNTWAARSTARAAAASNRLGQKQLEIVEQHRVLDLVEKRCTELLHTAHRVTQAGLRGDRGGVDALLADLEVTWLLAESAIDDAQLLWALDLVRGLCRDILTYLSDEDHRAQGVPVATTADPAVVERAPLTVYRRPADSALPDWSVWVSDWYPHTSCPATNSISGRATVAQRVMSDYVAVALREASGLGPRPRGDRIARYGDTWA